MGSADEMIQNMSKVVLFALLWSLIAIASSTVSDTPHNYIVLGVSGTLQDGFPLRDRLDYRLGHDDESRALLLGRALVRGYKAYLDIKQPGWREDVAGPGQPPINHAVLPSGCHEHANVYWVYAIDSRQVLSVLNNEPRFLSISPDTGLIDLESNETSDAVRIFARHEISRQGKMDMKYVAIPLVTAVWYHDSFIPSPPIRIDKDGTQITSFEGSLAIWARVSDEDRTACTIVCHNTAESSCVAKHERYWNGLGHAIRKAEHVALSPEQVRDHGPPFRCKTKTRFGVGPETARINNQFTYREIQEVIGTTT